MVVNLLKALGFFVLIFGTLLYHDLIPLFKAKKKQEMERSTLLETEPDEEEIEERLKQSGLT